MKTTRKHLKASQVDGAGCTQHNGKPRNKLNVVKLTDGRNARKGTLGNRVTSPKTVVKVTLADGTVFYLPARIASPRKPRNQVTVIKSPPPKRNRLMTDYVMGDTWQTANAAARDAFKGIAKPGFPPDAEFA